MDFEAEDSIKDCWKRLREALHNHVKDFNAAAVADARVRSTIYSRWKHGHNDADCFWVARGQHMLHCRLVSEPNRYVIEVDVSLRVPFDNADNEWQGNAIWSGKLPCPSFGGAEIATEIRYYIVPNKLGFYALRKKDDGSSQVTEFSAAREILESFLRE